MAPWGFPDSFVAEQQQSPWQPKAATPAIALSDLDKRRFGIELAKEADPITAACNAFSDTRQALWVAQNWINEPAVLAAKDAYLKTLAEGQQILDKPALLAKVRALAEGNAAVPIDAKERIAAWKLYSDIAGYTGRVDINNSVTNNNVLSNGKIELVLVKPEAKEVKPVKTIDQVSNSKSEIVNDEPLPIEIKLVGGVSR